MIIIPRREGKANFIDLVTALSGPNLGTCGIFLPAQRKVSESTMCTRSILVRVGPRIILGKKPIVELLQGLLYRGVLHLFVHSLIKWK